MRRIAVILFWLVIFAGLIVLVGFIEKEHKKITCKSIAILIDYNNADPLIDEHMIKKSVHASFDTLVGRRISDINLVEIEKLVQKNDFIANAQVFHTLTGHLTIKVVQKQPLLRIINEQNQNYYLAVSGSAMPVKQGFSSRILVASGHIPYPYSDTLNLIKNENFPILNDLHRLALHIKNDEFLNAMIEQIYVTQASEFELVPKLGKQIIQFGDINDMDQKFEKLIVFYRYGMGRAGWGTYKTINLRFRDQVVCSKN
jgi:cell division protein FtsQ